MRVALVLLLVGVGTADARVVVDTLAGSTRGAGFADGKGASARFANPSSIVSCGGALFVADTANHVIRKVLADQVTVYAGTPGVAGAVDGPSRRARFFFPTGVEAAEDCTLYVADRGNHRVRVVTTEGVSTLAGSVAGARDGRGDAAQFQRPSDVALDGDALYVSDSGNHTIRRVSLSIGEVATVAGTAGQRGNADGNANTAKFDTPTTLAFVNGSLYVGDYGNGALRSLRDGVVSRAFPGVTLSPGDLISDASGGLLVVDGTGQRIRRLTTSSDELVAGIPHQLGNEDGPVGTARFQYPYGIARHEGKIVVADGGNHLLRIVDGGTVTTLAGQRVDYGPIDGPIHEARFVRPTEVVSADDGSIYVYDANTIRRVANGVVTTIAGKARVSATVDGSGAAARFRALGYMTLAQDGSLYASDSVDHVIRRITPAGVVTTVAGLPGVSGFADGVASKARFNYPLAVTWANGYLYIADTLNHVIRRMDLAGNVTTFAGKPMTPGFATGEPQNARFNTPYDLEADENGNLWLVDENNDALQRVTPAGSVSTVARVPHSGTWGLAAGNDGDVFLSATTRHMILRVDASGAVSTIAGMDGAPGNVNGTGTTSRFVNPYGLSVRDDGSLLVADGFNAAIRVVRADDLPEVVYFSSDRAVVPPGAKVSIQWETRDATTVSLLGIGEVPTSGSMSIAVNAPTTFILEARNPHGAARAEVRVVLEDSRRRPVRP